AQADGLGFTFPDAGGDHGAVVVVQLDGVKVLEAPVQQLEAAFRACGITGGTNQYGQYPAPISLGGCDQAVSRGLGVAGLEAVDGIVGPEQAIAVVLLDVVVGVFLLAVI